MRTRRNLQYVVLQFKIIPHAIICFKIIICCLILQGRQLPRQEKPIFFQHSISVCWAVSCSYIEIPVKVCKVCPCRHKILVKAMVADLPYQLCADTVTLPHYRALRSHEIASACANSVQANAILLMHVFSSKDKNAAIFYGRQSSGNPPQEVRGMEKSSEEVLSTDEVHKSTTKPTLQKGTKKSPVRCIIIQNYTICNNLLQDNYLLSDFTGEAVASGKTNFFPTQYFSLLGCFL